MEDPATAAGALFGSFVGFPLIVVGIGYLIVRLTKKRSLTPKEFIIILIIGEVLAVLSFVARNQ